MDFEHKWLINGWDRDQQRHDILAYIAIDAETALAKCRKLHPSFDIDFIRREDI